MNVPPDSQAVLTAPPVAASPPQEGGRRGATRWWLLAVPIAAFLLVFFAYPSVIMLSRTFTDFQSPQLAGLDNVTWFLQNDVNTTILLRTFLVGSVSTALCILLAFPYAYTMTVVSPLVRTLMTAAVLLSMLAGILLRNFAWIVLLQRQGLINDGIEALGFERISFLGTSTAVIIGMTHVLFPFMVLPLYAVLRGIDRRLVLAAQSLGAHPTKAFLQVYLPLTVPGLVTGGTLVFVLSLGFFITPALLGSPQQAMISQLMTQQFTRMSAFGRAGVLALVLLLVTFLVVGLAQYLARRSKAYEAAS
jgi:putative spermidine/putrescine transport system permease protein